MWQSYALIAEISIVTIAEWYGLIFGLLDCGKFGITSLAIEGDSDLVVFQFLNWFKFFDANCARMPRKLRC